MHDSGRRRNRIVNLSGKGDCLSLMTMSVFARSFGARSFWQYRPLRSRVTVEGGRRTIYGIRLITLSASEILR